MSPRVWSMRKGAPTPPPGAVRVDRTSVFGNPHFMMPSARKLSLEQQRAHIEATFGAYLRRHPDLIERVRRELAGKDLVCWCAPLPCHADILLRVAAGEDP